MIKRNVNILNNLKIRFSFTYDFNVNYTDENLNSWRRIVKITSINWPFFKTRLYIKFMANISYSLVSYIFRHFKYACWTFSRGINSFLVSTAYAYQHSVFDLWSNLTFSVSNEKKALQCLCLISIKKSTATFLCWTKRSRNIRDNWNKLERWLFLRNYWILISFALHVASSANQVLKQGSGWIASAHWLGTCWYSINSGK